MRTICTATLLAAVLASGLPAQSMKSSVDQPKARELAARAAQIHRLTDFPEAARLYEQAASLMPSEDPETANYLFLAANIRYQGGKVELAQLLFERAAEAFSAAGDPGRAADSYVAATYAAYARKDRDQGRRYIDRAMVLISSPKVTEPERLSVLRRLSTPLAALGK